MKPSYNIRGVFTVGFPHPDTVEMVVVKSRANIPAIKGMRRPGAVLVGLDMDEDACSEGSQGGLVEVKLAMKVWNRSVNRA